MKNSKPAKGKALLVVHDVAPQNITEVLPILAELKAHSITTLNLGIVPFFHQAGRWDENPSSAQKINDEGRTIRMEILLHGYFHQRTGESQMLSWPVRFRSKLQSEGEDEFYKLEAIETSARLSRGLAVVKECFGVEPRGFIPPAWAMPPGLIDILKQFHIAYTENHFHIVLTRDGRKVVSPVIAFAARSASREKLSLAYSGIAAKLAPRGKVLRFVLHPADFRSKKIWTRAKEFLVRLDAEYDWCLYRDIFV